MTEQDPRPAPAGLQLDHAEFEHPAAAAITCSQCQQVVADQYYEAGGRMLCERCRRQLEADLTSGSPLGRFVLAGAFGAVAGAAGAVLWYAVTKMSHGSVWGLIAILVGWMVGAAVRVGARGRGGWPYQALAVVLTYLSIALANTPILVEEIRAKEGGTEATGIVLLVIAFVLALVAPFFSGFENIIGLLIIGFGLYQAWQMNKRVDLRFNGPFRVGSAPPPPVPAASA